MTRRSEARIGLTKWEEGFVANKPARNMGVHDGRLLLNNRNGRLHLIAASKTLVTAWHLRATTATLDLTISGRWTSAKMREADRKNLHEDQEIWERLGRSGT